MWYIGATWWTLFCAGLVLVGAFWFAAAAEDRKRRRTDEQAEYWAALKRMYRR